VVWLILDALADSGYNRINSDREETNAWFQSRSIATGGYLAEDSIYIVLLCKALTPEITDI
jgi:hypothetical protein